LRSVFAAAYADAFGEDLPSATVRQYCERWLAEKAVESGTGTLGNYRTTVRDFCDFLGPRADTDIVALTRTSIVDWRSDLSARLLPATVNRHLKILRMFFKAAHRDELIHENPAETVQSVATRTDSAEIRRPFTVGEVQALLTIADPEWQSLIKFGFYTGQRLGDLCLLTWSNIDLDRDELRFVTQKTGKRMVIPIAAPLRAHILSLSAPEDSRSPIHPRAHEAVSRTGTTLVGRWFAELLVAAGLRSQVLPGGTGRSSRRRREPLSFHSLRHSATTILHEAGVPSSAAQAMIGHDSGAVHGQYVSVGMEAVRKAAASLPEL
jgi:integrase